MKLSEIFNMNFRGKCLGAGPSDGKKSKVSPCIRAPAGVNAAVPLQVPPYFLFPASHS